MFKNVTAVALRTVRHNDRASILTAWSPELGRLSLVMPAGNGKESRRRRALTMPLSLFEGVCDIKAGAELHFIKDVRPWHPGGTPLDVAAHPVRATLAMFFSEVLGVVTREGEGDASLWALIVDTARAVSECKSAELANLPAATLLRLASVMGVEPDFGEWRAGMGLDMLEGVFRHTVPLHGYWVDPEAVRLIRTMTMAAENYRHLGILRLSKAVRRKLLDELLRYFALHHYPLDRLKSLDVLKTVFG